VEEPARPGGTTAACPECGAPLTGDSTAASTAETAAGALGAGAVDWLPPELERFAVQLDAIAGRLEDVCERLSVGVDPQRAGH
jgi:hypothetical protein